MRITKFSELLALIAWASVFTEAWLYILGNIEKTVLNGFFFSFFLVVAILSSAVAFRKT